MAHTSYATCNLCEAMCGVIVSSEGDRVVDLRGDPDDVLSRGHVCPKVTGLADLRDDPDRLRRPLRRRGESWEEIGWDDAFDLVAARLDAVRRAHGRASVATYQGNPTVHNLGSMMHGQLFFRTLGTPNNFSATSLDQLPHMLAGYAMFGHQLVLPVPDLDRTDLLIIMGANPLISNGSIMSAGDVKGRLKGIQARGGRIVVIDPRRTETAEMADQHVFIRPGTDALLLLAVLHEVFEGPGANLGRLGEFTDGVERLRELAAPYDAASVAEATGVSAEVTRQLAVDFASQPRAAWYGRVGVCTQEFGGLAAWLINAVNVITGHLDHEGGMMFARPALDFPAVAARLGLKGSFGRRRSRVRGYPEFGGEYPVATLADEIETPGDGRIRALITSAGNPVLSAPNGPRLERALDELDFMVSIDIYLNETTRHADVILPPTVGLEKSHYDVAFHMIAVRNTAKYSPAVFERAADARHDWEIFTELSTRLSKKRRLTDALSPLARRALLAMGPEPLLDLGLRAGPYGVRARGPKGLSLARLKKAPHGVDLGPLEPCLPRRLFNPAQRIALVPELYLGDLDRLRRAQSAFGRPDGALRLIGRRELRTNNSWMHNLPRMVKGKPRCTLRMHPEDAERLGLSDGGVVEVSSAAGTLRVPLEVTGEVMPGVVSLPHGWGHHRSGTRMRVANERPGVSMNDVTDHALVDELSGTARLSGVPVHVRAAPAEPREEGTDVATNPVPG